MEFAQLSHERVLRHDESASEVGCRCRASRGEPATSGRLVSLGLIVAGIIGLRLATPA
jgi:hypothetical protein